MALASLEPFRIEPDLPSADFQYQYTIDELREYVKCKDDPVYFIKNYMKIIDMDKGLVPFTLYPFQEQMINNFHHNRFNITMCSRQVGKALALGTPIKTTQGWKTIEDVHPGDYVYTPKGVPTQVIAESPIFYDHQTYELSFDAGVKVVADADHKWVVEIRKKRQLGSGRKTRKQVSVYETETLTTKDLYGRMQSGAAIRIPMSAPVEHPTTQLPIDPYLLGLWLGDGYSACARLIGERSDVDFYETVLAEMGYTFTENAVTGKEHLRLVKVDTLHTKLRELNLLNNKHIPSMYMAADVSQRLAVIQGLLDTDGHSNGRGSCFFYNKNKALIDSVREMLWSLGIKNRVRDKVVGGRVYYVITFSTTLPVFRLPRKVVEHNKTTGHQKTAHFYVSAVEPCGILPTKCISVDDPSHMFLCGKELIPTHNSTTVIGYFLHYVLFNVNVHVCISANKQKTAVDLLGRLKLAFEKLPRFLQQGITGWAQMEIKLSNGSRAFAAATSSSAVRGGSYNILLLDEFAFVPENIANEFYASTFPTITSGKTTKIIMVSTPNGMNLFHKFWVEAQRKDNDFVPLFVHWSEVPGRDEEWKQTTIRNIGGPEIFAQEYECVGPNTLVTVRDVVTGHIDMIPIHKLYDQLILN